MVYQTVHNRLSEVCRRNGADLKIEIFSDGTAPGYESSEGVLRLNLARIPKNDYEKYASYYALEYLIPRLQLETSRLILRRFRKEDAEDCYAFLSDPDGAYMDCCKPFSVMNKEYYERLQLFVDRTGQYAIVHKASGKVIGTVNLFEDNSRAVDAMEIYSKMHSFFGFVPQ